VVVILPPYFLKDLYEKNTFIQNRFGFLARGTFQNGGKIYPVPVFGGVMTRKNPDSQNNIEKQGCLVFGKFLSW